MKEEPSTAPVAMAVDCGLPAIIATIGTIVSGREVPSAASRLPVAPVPSFSRYPAHSTALVNSSAPITIAIMPAASRMIKLTMII